MSPYTGYIVETLLTLVIVCGLAMLVLYGARRVGIGRPTGPIELCGQLPLDARRAVYLVKVGAQVYVIGVAEGVMSKIGEMAASDLPAAPVRGGKRFPEIFARFAAKANEDADGATKAGRGSP